MKKWREENKDYRVQYSIENADRIAQKNKEWCARNRPIVRAHKRKWYAKHKDSVLAYHKQHYEANKDRLLAEMRAYQKAIRPKRTAYENEYRRERAKSDPAFLISRRLRARARIAFTRRGQEKRLSTSDLLGCTYEAARQHIEARFIEGMSWENHGEWHIDHIQPIAGFDLSKEEECRAAFHYTNLQPLWAQDNLAKGKKSEGWQKHENLAPRVKHTA